MHEDHSPDWIEASAMLRRAMEQYRDLKYYPSLPRVIDDVIEYIERHNGKWLNEKTIKRDAGNTSESKKLYRIPDWRIRIYAKWLYEEAGKDQDWLVKWLETTAYSAPGKLLAEISALRVSINCFFSVRAQRKTSKNRLLILDYS